MSREKTITNVPAAIAKEMVAAYAKESSKNPSYTKAVWFPAEQIIEIAKTLQDGKHDGLRIYFGQYTANALEGLTNEYLGRNTVLLTPTFAAGQIKSSGGTTGEHEDDTGDIGNKGSLCPKECDGTEL
ncbi:hypothetical protein [Pedobacter agri]|uniref:hypothetical protein n=1 Tax=Pedobacter agri TaxID=454586 RepID=UPI00292E5DF6|nr:hypothetical protein [Pedobacter agri]